MFACMAAPLIGSVQMSEPLQAAADFTAPRDVQTANYVRRGSPIGDAANTTSLLSDPAIRHNGQPAQSVTSGDISENGGA